jgi:hypothetical protein
MCFVIIHVQVIGSAAWRVLRGEKRFAKLLPLSHFLMLLINWGLPVWGGARPGVDFSQTAIWRPPNGGLRRISDLEIFDFDRTVKNHKLATEQKGCFRKPAVVREVEIGLRSLKNGVSYWCAAW